MPYGGQEDGELGSGSLSWGWEPAYLGGLVLGHLCMIVFNFQQAWDRRPTHVEKLRPREVVTSLTGNTLGTHFLLLSVCFPLVIRLGKAWKNKNKNKNKKQLSLYGG